MGEMSSSNTMPVPQHSIQMPPLLPKQLADSKPAPPQAPPLPPKPADFKQPSSFYLSDEENENYMKICVPLYHAALKGDWDAAEVILRRYPNVINMSITKRQETALHIVSSTKHTHFAKKLVKMMKAEDLELINGNGETALCLAVNSTVNMVDVLLKRNKDLLYVRKKGELPFLSAILSGDKRMVEHFYSKTNLTDERWNYSDKKSILNTCLAFGLLDIALKILVTTRKDRFMTIYADVLRYLAYNPSAFHGTRPNFIKRLKNAIFPGARTGPIDNFDAVKIVRTICGEIVEHKDILIQIAGEGLLFAAARLGNYKFIVELLRLYPDITWDRDENKHTIFHIAIMHRHESVYSLLYEFGSKKFGIRDNNGNNMLHLAAIKPKQCRLDIVSGAALQMQRELLWFKEVNTMVNLVNSGQVNNNGKSPHALFTEEHAELMEKGELWMKKTAAHCMVVAALIATIMFAAAFTLPGGNNDNNGRPIFVNRSSFIVFVVTDAISLLTSSTSILVFLAILMARYTENDFLVSLPKKLMIGVVSLFISIATMMIAFSASFFLQYSNRLIWIPILVSLLASFPVVFFAKLQYRLLIDVYNSTFNSRHLFRPKKPMFG